MSGDGRETRPRALRSLSAVPMPPEYRMTAREAVLLASRWWDKTGRGLINLKANEERAPDVHRGAGANGAPAIRVKGSAFRSVNSGIMDGRMWEDLDRRERLAIVKAWCTIMRIAIKDPEQVQS